MRQTLPLPALDDAALPIGWLLPSWSQPLDGVGAVMTARSVPGRPAVKGESVASMPPYDGFNLGDHVGDVPATVASHRAALASVISACPVWLKQVHGNRVPRVGREMAPMTARQPLEADGSWTTEPGVACTVMVADCLPVLLAAPQGRAVAALHAGWRGLAGAGADMAARGVLDAGVRALCDGASCEPGDLQAWLGPCIGPQAFEVGQDVLVGFGVDPRAGHRPHPRFTPLNTSGGDPSEHKWWGDLPGLAADRLHALGVHHITGGQWCTVSDASSFFSFRRDGVTGRQAASIWIRP